jgi:hypothetical protein
MATSEDAKQAKMFSMHLYKVALRHLATEASTVATRLAEKWAGDLTDEEQCLCLQHAQDLSYDIWAQWFADFTMEEKMLSVRHAQKIALDNCAPVAAAKEDRKPLEAVKEPKKRKRSRRW